MEFEEDSIEERKEDQTNQQMMETEPDMYVLNAVLMIVSTLMHDSKIVVSIEYVFMSSKGTFCVRCCLVFEYVCV